MYGKISPNPIRKSKRFLGSPSHIYHKINLTPVRYFDHFSSPSPIYDKIRPTALRQFEYFSGPSPVYDQVNPNPVR